jgi:hypothetical protein
MFGFLVAAGCTDPYPPVLFESTSLRGSIGVNDSAVFHQTSPNNLDLVLDEMSLDGVPRGRVSEGKFVFDVDVRGDRIEWLEGPSGNQRLMRRSSAGMETVELPEERLYDPLLLAPTGTFLVGGGDSSSVIAFCGPNGVDHLPVEAEHLRLEAADATHVYFIRLDDPEFRLVRYPLAGGPEEAIASNVVSAALDGDRLIYSTKTMLVVRSLVDASERVLSTHVPTWFADIVVAGDVVFWGNVRVMDGKSEEFLLPSGTGFISDIAVNSSDVYWVSSTRTTPLLLGQDGDFKLHRTTIRGDRPF